MFAVAITVYASTIVGLVKDWIWAEDYQAMIREEILTGLHRRPVNWRVLTTAYFHHPAALAQEADAAGFQHVATLGIEGPGWLVPDFDQRWDQSGKREVLMQIARLLEHEPAHSPHIVAVVRKP